MAKVSVYDPPMCCSTGVCGPNTDDKVVQFAAALDWARKSGAEVERYDLGHQPGAFATNAFVKGLLEKHGMGCLPLVLVDGDVLSKGEYPSREAISARLGLKPGVEAPKAACCAPAPSKAASASSACCGSTASAKAVS